jgi:hypothetical protein
MATTTNYGWTTPDDTALVKDGAAAIRTLGSSVDTTTKALNPSTTLGDIEYRSSTANTNTRLGIGSTGNILTVAGGVPTWAAPASAGGMTLISETTASALSSLSFTSLGSYKQLYLWWSGIKHSAQGSDFTIRLNADSTGANYQTQGSFTALGTTLGSTVTGNSGAVYTSTNNSPFGVDVEGNQTYQTVCGYFILDDYTSTTKYKNFRGHHGFYNNATTTYTAAIYNGFYLSTSAVTSIDITRLTGTQTFSNITNSTIRLYGIS